ncbi:MAG: hypothetical protein V3V95_08000 [Thermodesulfobacteriota bacterium]
MKIKLLLILSIIFASIEFAAAEPPGDAELRALGLSDEILKPLNRACKESISFDFTKEHRFWNATWNRKKKKTIVIIDFLQDTKHYSLALLPLKDGSCQTSRTITSYWTTPCKDLSMKYKEQFAEDSIDIKEVQDIFMWISSGKGTDVYLYDTPNSCVEVFREFFIRTPLRSR